MTQSLRKKIKAILFDLDGTLLEMNMKPFILNYLKGLSNSVAHIVSAKKFIPYIMKASKAMDNNDGKKTNEVAFVEAFFPFMGHTRHEIEPLFMEYYEKEFPKLHKYARKKPEARSIVQLAFDKGYDVVIATTPLLPLIAVNERLKWAGVADFPYRLITSYENTCSTKPNLLYYKQILDKIGHAAEGCLMVGDENKDMVAANLGIYTFLVPSPLTKLDPTTPEPNYRGTLADLGALL